MKGRTLTTGPKISSRGDRHVVLDVVEDRRLDEEALLAVPLTAGDQLGPLFLAQFDVAEDLVQLLLRDLRSLLGGRVERIADFSLFGLLGQAADELLADAVLDEQPAPRRAALAAVEVNRVKRAGHRLLEVGVGEDDVGALAAQLERAPLERVGRSLRDNLGRVDVTGEGDLVDARMGHHRVARSSHPCR